MTDQQSRSDDPDPTPPVEFIHRPELGRFAAVRAGREVAELDYRAEGGVWDLTHTWADPAVRGTGVASELVAHVMTQARAAGVRIIPSCPYVPVWLTRHPEYRDLVHR